MRSPLALFSLKSLHEFAIFVGTIEPIAYIVFCLVIKMGKSLQKTISNMGNSNKNILKTSNVPIGNTQKERNIISYIFRWIKIVPPPSSFF